MAFVWFILLTLSPLMLGSAVVVAATHYLWDSFPDD